MCHQVEQPIVVSAILILTVLLWLTKFTGRAIPSRPAAQSSAPSLVANQGPSLQKVDNIHTVEIGDATGDSSTLGTAVRSAISIVPMVGNAEPESTPATTVSVIGPASSAVSSNDFPALSSSASNPPARLDSLSQPPLLPDGHNPTNVPQTRAISLPDASSAPESIASPMPPPSASTSSLQPLTTSTGGEPKAASKLKAKAVQRSNNTNSAR
jgi:hypothetical protein